MDQFLFVYGTLRSEFGNRPARGLRAEATLIGPATVAGSVFHIRHYPGFRPDPEGCVHGELYRLHAAEIILAALDDYEGPEYERVQVAAQTGNGARDAWIYRYGVQPPLSRRIPSGDFCRP